MANIIISYFWKYVVSGLVLTTIYGLGLSMYICYKCDWDEDKIDDCLDVFAKTPGYGRFCRSKSFKKIFKKYFPICILLWPMNIATGLSRIPEVIEYINNSN